MYINVYRIRRLIISKVKNLPKYDEICCLLLPLDLENGKKQVGGDGTRLVDSENQSNLLAKSVICLYIVL